MKCLYVTLFLFRSEGKTDKDKESGDKSEQAEDEEKKEEAMDAEDKDEKPEEPSRPIATKPVPGRAPWVIVFTSDDRTFFFNQTTTKSVWSVPEELADVDNIDELMKTPRQRALEGRNDAMQTCVLGMRYIQ